jgi:hypothetical protein
MGEYGRIVGQSSGASGGGGGGTDLTGQVMGAISDAVDQVASLPPEMLVGIAVVVLIVGMLVFRR